MDVSRLQQILGSAEQAAAGGDYSSAEALLREAARLQEASLGPHHPDLASTFNNLGIVCEKANQLAAAEEFYRRAFSIASVSLSSDHPLFITSRDNLDEFRRAHGRFAQTVPSQGSDAEDVFPPETTVPQGTTVSQEAAVPRENAVPEENADRTATERTSRKTMFLSSAAVVLVVVVALAMWLTRMPLPRSNAAGDSTAPAQKAPSSGEPAGRQSAQPVAESNRAQRQAVSAADRLAKTADVTPTTGDPRVVEALLCQSLSPAGARWQCTAPRDSSSPGQLFFYTRIAAPQNTRVHHRWYRNGRLRQDVTLAVGANPVSGYRTFTRQRVNAGDWKVELVTAEGVVLREESVAIR